ncbi:hypothetical protein TVAG_387940 [Trichomonas vaginalis G3]|uniref:Uncharacterized protein n=1 Tax=Trichomonas vaginalis (strain ATCC PRA-98 / G3) TaxID=412133 RepID=A2E121_TRIV3|nr:hypothetical protein TVAGG3_0330600 [Trichomonas vaginalis G3]EAY13653.1 hypothetical protein TVAG_387940 [Trichomonas vaginalis G3]KAI5529927.1 hypothetical protein TVAGG3_0330600 [Trichomonas vaginalis G3]|eukprot:XP_001325876.1 hypothetical protein [Trichomonas vaginalis G3]
MSKVKEKPIVSQQKIYIFSDRKIAAKVKNKLECDSQNFIIITIERTTMTIGAEMNVVIDPDQCNISFKKSKENALYLVKQLPDKSTTKEEILAISPVLWISDQCNMKEFIQNSEKITSFAFNQSDFNMLMNFSHKEFIGNTFYDSYNNFYNSLTKKTYYHSLIKLALGLIPNGKFPSPHHAAEMCSLFIDILFSCPKNLKDQQEQVQSIFEILKDILHKSKLDIIIPPLTYLKIEKIKIDKKEKEDLYQHFNYDLDFSEYSQELLEHILSFCPRHIIIRTYHPYYHKLFCTLLKIASKERAVPSDNDKSSIREMIKLHRTNITFLTSFIDFARPLLSQIDMNIDSNIIPAEIDSEPNLRTSIVNYINNVSPPIKKVNCPNNAVIDQFLNLQFPKIEPLDDELAFLD